MTQRYDWTPANEPPDTGRDVEVWWDDETAKMFECTWGRAYCVRNRWSVRGVLHWRDVEPPNCADPDEGDYDLGLDGRPNSERA